MTKLKDIFNGNPIRFIITCLIIVGVVLEQTGLISVGTTSGIVIAVLAILGGELARQNVYSAKTVHEDIIPAIANDPTGVVIESPPGGVTRIGE